jgi:thioredoxin-related protein
MLFEETVAVYCENHTEHTDTVRTSQETHYISATKPIPLMLFGKTVAVYCENHTEYVDTVRTSHETYYITATKPNRLMLFGETVAVYCGNHRKQTYVRMVSLYNLHVLNLGILRKHSSC